MQLKRNSLQLLVKHVDSIAMELTTTVIKGKVINYNFFRYTKSFS